MESREKIIHTEPDGSVREYAVVEPFDVAKAHRMKELELKKQAALALGVEPFDAKKALAYYYPNDLTGDEAKIEADVESLESDYYFSGAKTIAEWAKVRESYDQEKDSD